jgi:hypothetical protein
MGGAIFNEGGTVVITNSTFTGDSAVAGAAGTGFMGHNGTAGKGLGGGLFNLNGTITLTNSTFSGNTAADGGRDVFNLGDSVDKTYTTTTTATATITNTILGQADTAVEDFTGTTAGGTNTTTGTNNLIRTSSGIPAGAIVSTANPLLAALANNGGPTPTMALQTGSPAIDAGDDSVLGPPLNLTTDQRGTGFARKVGAHVDIGAYEGTVPFSDNFTGTGSLSSNWQIPALPEKFLFVYRRRPGFGGFTENNKAISVGTGFDAEQVVGLSLLDPTITADVTLNGAQAVGVAARIQGNDNAYVAVLTSDGQARIGFFNAATNSITDLATPASGLPTVGTFTLQLVVSGSSLSLYVNSVLKVSVPIDQSIAAPGGFGIFALGAGASVDNFSVSGS